jgi:murein DD-endopeptidase MepM/ murein hydrolase activator NlpD
MRHRPSSPRLVLTTALVLGSLVLGVLTTAQADDKDRKRSVDKKIAQLKGDLEDTSQKLQAAIHALNGAEAKLATAQGKVARVRGRLAAAQTRDRMLAGKLALAQAEVDRAQKQIAATEARIDKTRDVIGSIARSSYQQGSLAEFAVVLNAESPDDFATRVVLVQNAMRSEGAALTGLADDKADLAAQRATLDAKRAQIAEVKRQQEELVATIQGLEQDALDAQAEVQSLVSDRAAAVQTVEAERAAERDRLAAAQAQSRALAKSIEAAAARAAAKARLSGRPSGGSGGLAWPANGRISTYAGYRTNPVTGSPSCHSGIDIAPGYGAPIFAAAAGVVVATTFTSWDGNTTIIAHGGGMTTWYAHQDSFGVHVGQHVGRGEVIGHVGATGFATGPHLHFNVVIGQTAYDPMAWFGGPMRTVASLCPNGPSPVL